MEITVILNNKKVYDREITYFDFVKWLGLATMLLLVVNGDVNSLKLIDKVIRL